MLSDNATWKFSCEMKEAIPLPPEYTFPQAFNYLNSDRNYIQCGGSKERCTVELRVYRKKEYDHFRLGKTDGSDAITTIKMSAGEVEVLEREVFTHWEAIELFKAFYANEEFPAHISERIESL
jgi:hypothetical protein